MVANFDYIRREVKHTTMKHLLLISAIFVFAACKKANNNVDALPPITQTGAGTFGCLINGKVYTPKGFEQNRPNFDMVVDPYYNDGSIDIRVFNKEGDITEGLNFGSDSVSEAGLYTIGSRSDFSHSIYSRDISDFICETPYTFGSNSDKTGFIKIARYDLVNRIFSGEFEFHFVNPDCGLGDTIHITQGRFDKKIN